MVLYSSFGLLFAATALGSSHVKRSALTDCLSTAKVPQALPGTSGFTQGIKPFNLRLQYTPAALAQPTTVQEVQAAVSCAASLGIKVSPKSGGHSYASHGLGGEDGHLCIDMRKFSSVSIDAAGIASIGPGGRLGNVATALYTQGKKAISHGTCPGVGVAGLTLHGGYGFSSHTYGLTLDNLVEATVVLANSTVVTASKTQNPDLFWALRGAGGSFGVVTNFKFQTFTPPDSTINFSFNINAGSASQAKDAIKALQDFTINTQPAELNMRLMINSFSAQLLGTYLGSQANFQTAMQPLASKLGFSTSGGGGFFGGGPSAKGWLDTLSNYAYGSLQTPFEYDTHETFFSKSLMTPELNTAAIGALADYWFNSARSISRDWFLILDCHGGKYSAISKVAANETSYGHRNAIFKMEFYDRVQSGAYPSNGFSFLNGWVDAIEKAQGTGPLGMYINYADPTLSAETAHKVYWPNTYERLSTIKTAYDPKKLFMNPQAINS